jgi:hypothetical protein
MNEEKNLTEITNKNNSKTQDKQFSEKELDFLQGLSESVEFANNYKTSGKKVPSLKEFLDNL